MAYGSLPGPFQVGDTNTLDPLSYGLEQYNYEMSQANQGGYDAGSDALAQAIAQQQAASQADTAPSMDMPFPQGGLKGALFGLFAGMAGKGTQAAQQQMQAQQINMRQEGFLRLRQADRDKTIANLQMKQAGLDADYEQTMAKLRAETNMDQARLLSERLNQIRKDKALRDKTNDPQAYTREVIGLSREFPVAGIMQAIQAGDKSMAQEALETWWSPLEGLIASAPEGNYMKTWALGEYRRLNAMVDGMEERPVGGDKGFELNPDLSSFGSTLATGGRGLGEAFDTVYDWFSGAEGSGESVRNFANENLQFGETELPPGIMNVMNEYVPEYAMDFLEKGPASMLAQMGPVQAIQMAYEEGALEPSEKTRSILPSMGGTGLNPMSLITPNEAQVGRLQGIMNKKYPDRDLDKDQREIIRKIRQLNMSEARQDASFNPLLPGQVGYEHTKRNARDLREKLIQLREKLLARGMDADGYLTGILGERYQELMSYE